MISVEMAKQLKALGLKRKLTKNDFFYIPDRGLDDIIFVINDMTILIEQVQGKTAVTFHGTAEWAIDHVWITELVWLPTEEQLREELEKLLIGAPEPTLVLVSTADGYRCEIHFKDQFLAFEGFGVSEVYSGALLYVLQQLKQK